MLKFLSASLLGALLPVLFSSPVKAQDVRGEFTYLGNDDVTVRTTHYNYSDAFFDSAPTESSYALLECSMCAALAASRAEYLTAFMDKLGFSYTNDVNEIEKKLNVLAGAQITDSVYYPAQIIDGVDYYNSIAYGIGKKQIGDTTLVIVGIRGSDYGIEWGGDFDIGAGENHEGFEIAAEQVLNGLKTFLEREKISGKIKVWISGYSRGAATGNLLAAKLDDGAIEGIGSDNVYAFCFECPRVTRSSKAFDAKYDNIVSIANPDDIVPKVAMGVWGYKRFGRTYHIPAYQSDYDFLGKLEKKDVAEKAILGTVLDTAKDVEYQLNTFVSDLALVSESPEGYVKNYQTALIHLAMSIFGNPTVKATNEDYLALRKLEESLVALNLQNTREIAGLLGLDEKFNRRNESPLLNVHNMENSLAWIESLGGYDAYGPNATTILYFNNVEAMRVTDEKGATVLNINATEVLPERDALFCRIKESGEIVVVFPQNGVYHFEITGSREKYVLLSQATYDMVLGYPSEVFDYSNIVLDQTITGVLDHGRLQVKKGSKEYEPAKTFEGEEVKLLKILGIPEGDGIVIGGGLYTVGQKASLYARPKPGSSFDGWYEGDKKVSDKERLILRVDKDIFYTAKFTK